MHDDIPPFREGLFLRDPPRLIGSRCVACGVRVFPARGFCPACESDEPPAAAELSEQGTVHTWTIVRQAPGQRPVPYTLAYVDLDDGVRVMAQVDAPPEAVRIGLRVGLVLRNVVPAPGEARLGYAFAPLAHSPSHRADTAASSTEGRAA